MSQDPDKDRKDHHDDEPEGNLNPSWLNQLPHVGDKREDTAPKKEVAKSTPEPELPEGTEISSTPPKAGEGGTAPDTSEAPWLKQLDKKKPDKRRVARTMLESDLPALGELYQETPSKKKDKKPRKDKKDKRKVARTMLESDLPDLESLSLAAEQANEQPPAAPPEQPPREQVVEEADFEEQVTEEQFAEQHSEEKQDIAERKVAKTMLEAEIPSMESLMPEPEPSERLAPEPSELAASPVARTMLEMEMPSSMELTGGGESEQLDEPVEDPTSFEPAPEFAPVPESTVQARAFDESYPPAESPLYEPSPYLQEEPPAPGFAPAKKKTRLTGEVKIHRSFDLASEHEREEGETTQQRYVARTMLDTDLIREQLTESIQRMEALAEEEAKRKALEPQPEFIPIDKFEIATPCKWKWNDEEITGHVAYCELCGIQVYNFEGLQLPEAQKIIFQREGKNNPTLYKRKDGKFMTQDCPIETRKQKNIRTIVVAIIAFFLFFVILIPLLSPKTPIGGTPVEPTPSQPPPVQHQTHSTPEDSSGTSGPQSTGTQNAPQTGTQTGTAPSSSTAPQTAPSSSHHWEAGDPPPAPVVSTPPQPVAPPDNSPYADESGQFWEYSK